MVLVALVDSPPTHLKVRIDIVFGAMRCFTVVFFLFALQESQVKSLIHTLKAQLSLLLRHEASAPTHEMV